MASFIVKNYSKYIKAAMFLLLCLTVVFDTIFIPCNVMTPTISFRFEPGQETAVYDDVEIVGINQDRSRNDSKAKYILLLPRSSQCSSCRRKAWRSINHLISLLSSLKDVDGASCHGGTRRHKSCRFYTKHWTMVINNGNELQTRTTDNQNYKFYNCNIVEGPLLIRREIFNKLGLRPSHGETTLLEFFLRSKGNLQIADSLDCSFNNKQLASNRGAMASNEIYLDYGLLGNNHNILRIINVHRESIIWTQCTRSTNTSVCPNKPLQDIDTSISRKLSTYCCNVALDKYLIDAVTGLEKTGIDYRLCYGTTLGAMREKSIIPWTLDIDIDISYTNYLAFSKLQPVMQTMPYSTPVLGGLRRILPLFPLVTHVQNLSRYNLFSDVVLGHLRNALPINKPNWQSLGYVDIYPYKEKGTFGAPSNITINGRLYKTHSDPESYLVKTFGESWRVPHYTFSSETEWHVPDVQVKPFGESLREANCNFNSISYVPALKARETNISSEMSVCGIIMLLIKVYCVGMAIFVAAKYEVFHWLCKKKQAQTQVEA